MSARMPEQDLVHALAAMTPARVLNLVCGGGEPAAVSVYLSSGQVLDGHLAVVDEDHGHEVAVLLEPSTGRLRYFLTASVVAVDVLDPRPFTDILTAGRLPVPDDGEEVTRLGLRREFEPDDEFPVRVDWAAMPDSGPVLANLARVLRGLRSAAQQVRADEMGRLAWERVHALEVWHRDGVGLSVHPVPDGLSVTTDLAAALPRDIASVLLHEINALL